MKKKDIEQLRNAAASELDGKIRDAKAKLQGLFFDRELGKLKNVKEIGGLKKDIARMLTFRNQQTAKSK